MEQTLEQKDWNQWNIFRSPAGKKWLQKKTVGNFLDLDQPEKVEERQDQFPSISLARPRRPRHVNLYSMCQFQAWGTDNKPKIYVKHLCTAH